MYGTPFCLERFLRQASFLYILFQVFRLNRAWPSSMIERGCILMCVCERESGKKAPFHTVPTLHLIKEICQLCFPSQAWWDEAGWVGGWGVLLWWGNVPQQAQAEPCSLALGQKQFTHTKKKKGGLEEQWGFFFGMQMWESWETLLPQIQQAGGESEGMMCLYVSGW